ncbi:MAG: hypothetical protein WC457_00575 [Patescibacteria group bacterium]
MLSPKAEKLINDYFNLPFKGLSNIRCPYFNNARRRGRGQLRALIGKGTPTEIVEEAKILSIQYHYDFFDFDGRCKLCGESKDANEITAQVRKFLIDNDLGIDCSGFAAHVLRAYFRETRNIDIFSRAFSWPVGTWIRRIIAKLRPAENLSVRVLANNKFSELISDGRKPFDYAQLKPGDILTMLETGPQNKRNHILIVEGIDAGKISYIHARAWSVEGQYGHGVSHGEIEILTPERSLLDQTWEELGKLNDTNETYLEAKNAKVFEVRRIKL